MREWERQKVADATIKEEEEDERKRERRGSKERGRTEEEKIEKMRGSV